LERRRDFFFSVNRTWNAKDTDKFPKGTNFHRRKVAPSSQNPKSGGVHNKSCEIERCTSGAGSRDPHDSPGFSKSVSRAALHEYH
jgi:hypothetical protein